MRRPNFFIVGAPKCGTTAMYSYLKQHPDVFLPEKVKEPHYFGSDLHFRYRTPLTEEQYLRLFEPARQARWIGEASVWYLYSTEAAKEIKAFDPNARIVIMLRNPVDMVYSLHSQHLYGDREDLVCFEDALDAEEDRKNGRRVPRGARLVKSLFYREVGRYSEQVKRYLDTFGADQVHVIIYDDFRGDTPGVYRSTLEFLDVDPDAAVDFKVVNPNTIRRNRFLATLTMTPPAPLRWVARSLLPVRKWRLSLGAKLSHANTIKAQRPPLAADTRAMLQEVFAPDVRELSAVIGRDLSHWTDA